MEIVVGYLLILVVSTLDVSDNNSFRHFLFHSDFFAKTAFFCLLKRGRIPIAINFKHRLKTTEYQFLLDDVEED